MVSEERRMMVVNKKVLVLGAGPYGQRVAWELLKTGTFSSLVITDLVADRAETVAATLKQEGVIIKAAALDATRPATLLKAIKGMDLVVNVTGPMQDTAGPTVEACIASGVSYVDTSATLEPVKALLKRDRAAMKAGVSILTGFGGASGMVNFLARYGVDKLDVVEEIRFAVVGYQGRPVSRDMSDEYLRTKFMDPAEIYQDGRIVKVRTHEHKETVEIPVLREVWPDFATTWEVWPMVFSQVATFPHFLKGLKNLTVKCGPNCFSELARIGLGSLDPVEVRGVKVSPVEFAIAFSVSDAFATALGLEVIKDMKPKGGWLIQVIGQKHGKPARSIYEYVDVNMHNTQRTCALAAKWLMEKKITATGVVAPEALDPRPFLKKALEWGTVMREHSSQVMVDNCFE
jgi:saccharopine dehydrogenase-like NADP-dependent oxidoreductase